MKGDLILNNGTVDNTATIYFGEEQVNSTKPISDATKTISDIPKLATIDSDSTSLTTTPSIDSQQTIIICTVVVSGLVALVLLYFTLIRPSLKRKALKNESPLDTRRAPMDPVFRQRKKKNWLKGWIC